MCWWWLKHSWDVESILIKMISVFGVNDDMELFSICLLDLMSVVENDVFCTL